MSSAEAAGRFRSSFEASRSVFEKRQVNRSQERSTPPVKRGRAIPKNHAPAWPPERSSSVPVKSASVEEFFFHSTRPGAFCKKSSSLSERSARTVSSLRESPVVDPSLLPENEFAKWSQSAESKHRTGSPRSIFDAEESLDCHLIDEIGRGDHLYEQASPDDWADASFDITAIKEETEYSETSLTGTDVQFLVAALKRVAGEDFSELIESVKRKEEPVIPWLFKESSDRPVVVTVDESGNSEDYESHVSQQKPPVLDSQSIRDGSLCRISVENKEPHSQDSPFDEYDFDESRPISKRGSTDSGLEQPIRPAEKRGYSISQRVNSILQSEEDRKIDDGEESDGSSAVEIQRKISFSTQDRIRFYELPREEAENKKNLGVHESIAEARRRSQVKKFSGVCCMGGPQVNQAAVLLSKIYNGGVETAKEVRRTCEEKGWLNESDRLMRYFKKPSGSMDPTVRSKVSQYMPCGRTETVAPTDKLMEAALSVPMVQTSESKEGQIFPPPKERVPGTRMDPERSGTPEPVYSNDWKRMTPARPGGNPFREPLRLKKAKSGEDTEPTFLYPGLSNISSSKRNVLGSSKPPYSVSEDAFPVTAFPNPDFLLEMEDETTQFSC